MRFKQNVFSRTKLKQNMPKAIAKKLYKVTRKEINDSKNNFVVKFKGLSKAEIKQLRTDLDNFLRDYLEKEEEKSDQVF